MSESDYQTLLRTGKVPATRETFISPELGYSQGYRGVTAEIRVEAGTKSALESVGVRDFSGLTKSTYPNMPTVQKGWNSTNAYFKQERKDLINIGLGRGPALDIFNEGIVGFRLVGGR
jgi:hypothetical protein